MGFAAGVAIVTVADVEAISGEGSLANFDLAGATLAAKLPAATDSIMRDLKRWREKDPARVSNTTDFKAAAAYWVCWVTFRAQDQADQENRDKAQLYKGLYEEQVKTLLLDMDDLTESPPKGYPVVLNLDALPSLAGPVDNRRPNNISRQYWRTGT